MLKWFFICAAFAKARFEAFLAREDGEVNIVAIVVLIGIAILLAILFRNYITNLLNMLFGQVNNTARNAILNEG
jgi:hypothetical protein